MGWARSIAVLLGFGVAAGFLFGPGSIGASEPGFPLRLKDALGVEVELEARPGRIVSLAPSLTEIAFGVGAGPAVVGVTEFCDFPPEARGREKVGGFSNPSLERVVALRPDLVLVARHNPTELVDALRRMGLKAFAFNPGTMDQVFDAVGILGRLTGNREAGDSLVTRLRHRVSDIERKVRKAAARPRVMWGNLEAPTFSAGPGSFIGDLIERAGGINVASDTGSAWPQLGIEAIVSRDPEVIITSSGEPGEIGALVDRARRTPGWREVTAVKKGSVAFVHLDLIGRPGPRLVDGLEVMARVIHPEVFAEDTGKTGGR